MAARASGIAGVVTERIDQYLADNGLRGVVDFHFLALGPIGVVEKAVVWLTMMGETMLGEPMTLRLELTSSQCSEIATSPETCTAYCNHWIADLTEKGEEWAEDLPLVVNPKQVYGRLDDLVRTTLDGSRYYEMEIDRSGRGAMGSGREYLLGLAGTWMDAGVTLERRTSLLLSRAACLDLLRDNELREEVVTMLADRLRAEIPFGEI